MFCFFFSFSSEKFSINQNIKPLSHPPLKQALGNFVRLWEHLPLVHRQKRRVFFKFFFLLLQTTTHTTSSSVSREGLLGVLCWSQASHVPRGSGDESEVVKCAGVPSYQTMGTLRMQVGPGLCGLEQLLKPQGEQQAPLMSRKREEAALVLAEREGP